MRVLVAEDHERLARFVAAGLRRYGMTVDIALHGDDALARLAANSYDVVVLDRNLPGTHGDDICRALLAERSESRVLMLTAASCVKDRVEGLGLGADDYLPKPFDVAEIVARVQALGRRPGAVQTGHLGYRDLGLDPAKRVATRGGRPLDLRRKEFDVLACLWPPTEGRCRPKSSSNGCGTRSPIPSPRLSKPPSTGCGLSSGSRRSSKPSAMLVTASEDHDVPTSSTAKAACLAALAPPHRPTPFEHASSARRLGRCWKDAAAHPGDHPYGTKDFLDEPARAAGARRSTRRAQGARRHPR